MPEIIIWENTKEFEELFNHAQNELEELRKRWEREHDCRVTSFGSIDRRMSDDGKMKFWLNTHNPDYYYGIKHNWSVEEATRSAMKYAADGWWTPNDLRNFLDKKGPLFEESMHKCGFRPHKKYLNKWARIDESKERKELYASQEERVKKAKEEFEKEWPEIIGTELERLKALQVLPNKEFKLNDTYNIYVNKVGLIHIFLEVNPFSATRTEQLGWFGSMLRARFHVAKNQDGFNIEAKNVRIAGEQAVYLKFVRPDNSFIESVWPHFVSEKDLRKLADDLLLKMRKKMEEQ